MQWPKEFEVNAMLAEFNLFGDGCVRKNGIANKAAMAPYKKIHCASHPTKAILWLHSPSIQQRILT
jgi:hypothetical protein